MINSEFCLLAWYGDGGMKITVAKSRLLSAVGWSFNPVGKNCHAVGRSLHLYWKSTDPVSAPRRILTLED